MVFLAVFVAGLVVKQSYSHEPEKRLMQLEFTEQIEKTARSNGDRCFRDDFVSRADA